MPISTVKYSNNYILVGCPWTQRKRKERSISCIAIADIINDQVEAMVLIKETRAQVLLTLLLQGKQTLLDLSSVYETVKPRSL